MKKIIKLTETDLRSIIKESVNKIINEILDDPYDYAKVKGLSAAAYEAANTPDADPKWAERKIRQANAIKDRWRKLSNEYSKLEDNDSGVKWAMAGMNLHRAGQGIKDPKGYIRRNGYGNYLKGVTESDLHKIVKESTVNEVMHNGYSYHGNDKTSWDMVGAQRETNTTLRLGDLFNAVEGGDINKAQTVLKQLKHNIKQSQKDDVNSRSFR